MKNESVSTREEMTTEWFASLLVDAGVPSGGSIKAIQLEPVVGGVMTNMVRAKLTYANARADNAPASLLVKYPSDDEGNLGVARLMGLYELEVRFYQDIASQLPNMRIPKCYYAQLDEQSGRFALVLEDLGGSTKSGAMLNSVTWDECSAVFRELANFQTPLWNSPALPQFNWLNNPQRTHGLFDAFSAGLDPFLKRFGHLLNPEYVKLFESVLPLAGQWARSWQAPTVLQHGEFRSGNILFGTTPNAAPVTVIDFQTVRVGPPGIDPAYFMGGSMPTEDRRKMEHEMVKEYHQRLLSAGVTAYNWDACWKAYCAGAMYGVYLLVGMSGQVEANDRNDQVILDLVNRMAVMALDLESAKAAGLA